MFLEAVPYVIYSLRLPIVHTWQRSMEAVLQTVCKRFSSSCLSKF